jgi:hypothetical protein
VEARAIETGNARGRRAVDRVAALFLLLVMAAGCLVLWIGIPVAVLWGLSKLTDSFSAHFVLGLVGVPVAMALFSPALFWVNGLYLRVTGALDAADDEEEARWRLHGPLELFLYVSMVIAVVALFVWFFGFATNPPEVVW